MRAVAVLLIISSVISALVAASRIVGGEDAEDGKNPYQASIRKENFPVCGGSIINTNFILTAAHCIYRHVANEFVVVVGTNYLVEDGILYKVNELIWHNLYNEITLYNDIGLIKIRGYMVFTEKLQPIPLATDFYIPPEESATVTGWGRLYGDINLFPNVLQVINVSITSQEICQQVYWQATKNNICTCSRKNVGVCNGDSGGPLVVRGKQVGIVSYGQPCALGFPDVYTRVYPYKAWINSTIKSRNFGAHKNPSPVNVLLFAMSCILFYLYPISQGL